MPTEQETMTLAELTAKVDTLVAEGTIDRAAMRSEVLLPTYQQKRYAMVKELKARARELGLEP